jgi:hypothetical protein
VLIIAVFSVAVAVADCALSMYGKVQCWRAADYEEELELPLRDKPPPHWEEMGALLGKMAGGSTGAPSPLPRLGFADCIDPSNAVGGRQVEETVVAVVHATPDATSALQAGVRSFWLLLQCRYSFLPSRVRIQNRRFKANAMLSFRRYDKTLVCDAC